MWLGDDADGHFVECGQHNEHDLRQGFGASAVDVVWRRTVEPNVVKNVKSHVQACTTAACFGQRIRYHCSSS